MGFTAFCPYYFLLQHPDASGLCAIKVKYENGPFKYLHNQWKFARDAKGCAVDFYVDFEFRSFILQKAIGAVFTEAVRMMVNAFLKRARTVCGPPVLNAALPVNKESEAEAQLSLIQEQKTGRLVPLEGLRGIAAIIVMLGHMVRGLVPPDDVKWHGLHQVHRWLLNGGAAVTIFFVLSGFILSLPFAKDRSRLRVLTALLKRWPRLAVLTTIACLFSWGLIVLSQDNYTQAAAVTGNAWMAAHFNSPLQGQEISWMAALREGLYRVFLSGDSRFDSPLWTMRIELFGSFAIFLAAPILFAMKHWPLRLAAIGAVMVGGGASFPLTYISDFLVGTILAMLFAEDRMPKFSNLAALAMGVAGIYLFCFSAGENHFIHAPIKALLPAGETAHFVWDVSAVLIILVLLGNPFLRRLFSKNWAIWLGLLSFPIYLLHVPIMLSAGAASIVHAVGPLGETSAVLLAAAVTMALTLACALPLAWVDKAWTGALARAAAVLTRRRPAGVRPAA